MLRPEINHSFSESDWYEYGSTEHKPQLDAQDQDNLEYID